MSSAKESTLSIVIVTYNSEKTIELCLSSLKKSDFQGFEVIIIDNDSNDETVHLIERDFPDVKLIPNSRNIGFAKACNQGAQLSNAEYLFFLNPDCMIQEDTIDQLLSVARLPSAGITGPLLIDGAGKVLPESGRNKPTLLNGLCHLVGLPLPESLGYYKSVKMNQTEEVSVLSGACMLLKSSIFKSVGGFDERYFMYGEDMDLSSTINESGFQNYCVAKTVALHFKGESTDRTSFQYSVRFYLAIIKYIIKRTHGVLRFLMIPVLSIMAAIAIIMSWVINGIRSVTQPLLDAAIIVETYLLTQFSWSYLKHGDHDYFGQFEYVLQYLLYAFILLILIALGGAYTRTGLKLSRVVSALIFGSLIVGIVYSGLPGSVRFSRGVVFFGSLIASFLVYSKYLFVLRNESQTKVLITDTGSDKFEVPILFSTSEIRNIDDLKNKGFLDKTTIVFDFLSTANSDMFSIMKQSNKHIYKFWNERTGNVFFSDNKTLVGSYFSHRDYYNLNQRVYKIHKRAFDLSVLMMLSIPLIIIKLISGRFNFSLFNSVFLGKSTIVGYDQVQDGKNYLPRLKPSLIKIGSSDHEMIQSERVEKYAYSYTVLDDLYAVLQNFRQVLNVLILNKKQ